MTSRSHLAGVVLAAGAGRRLRPLTNLLPKPLCPVGGEPLIDHALQRLQGQVEAIAVNMHHHTDLLDAALPTEIHRSHEHERALGTAGALGHLRPWIDGRDVLVTNADAWFESPPDIERFVSSWDGKRSKLLCVETGLPADFGTLKYCGVALIPGETISSMSAEPSGLYEVTWAREAERDEIELVSHPGVVIDCGTPSDYLAANLMASGGESVTSGAVLHPGSEVIRSVVWPGSEVWPGEVLENAIRAEHLTVLIR